MSLFEPTGEGDHRQHAPATERNREPILSVLRRVLPETGTVLEIAAGTGQHACFFAAAFPGVVWRPSDPDPTYRASIAAWREHAGPSNLEAPIALDVRAPVAEWGVTRVDAVLCVNMIHISPWAATLGLFAGAGVLVPMGGALVTYGPFRRDGAHTAPSNVAFDADLRARNPEWGIRDVAEVAAVAGANGFALAEVTEMPANNLTLVFRK